MRARPETSGYDLDLRSRLISVHWGVCERSSITPTLLNTNSWLPAACSTWLAPMDPHNLRRHGKSKESRDCLIDLGNWTILSTLSVNYQSAFSITDPTIGANTCLAALKGRSPSAYGSAISATVTTLPSQWYPYCSVQHFTDVNLYASYNVSDHFQVHGAITNLFGSQPPVDLQTYGGGAELAYTTLDQDGAVGRFFLVGATYKF